jgi:cold shock CspA family protein
MTTSTGSIKMFSEAKRFGFIESESLPENAFFHMSDCDFDVPRVGDRVEFELKASPKGPRATSVRLVD